MVFNLLLLVNKRKVLFPVDTALYPIGATEGITRQVGFEPTSSGLKGKKKLLLGNEMRMILLTVKTNKKFGFCFVAVS